MNHPTSHITLLYRLLLSTTKTSWLTAVVSLIALPLALTQPRGLPKLAAIGIGLTSTLACKSITNSKFELLDNTTDLNIVDRQSSIRWYSDVVSGVKQLTTSVINTPKYDDSWVEDNLITSPLEHWLNTGKAGIPGKHLLVIGGTNDGKTSFITALASQLNGWNLKAYDIDGTIDDWQFIPEDRRVYDLTQIESAMVTDMEVLEKRIVKRREVGRRWSDTPQLTIAEELPALVSSSDVAKEWVVNHAKRGRKPLLFIAAVAQNDTVKNLGIEGDASIRDSCFTRVYLGQKARERAQKLGNTPLLTWLEGATHGRFIVDDLPCEFTVNTHQLTNTIDGVNTTHVNCVSELTDATHQFTEVELTINNSTDGVHDSLTLKTAESLTPSSVDGFYPVVNEMREAIKTAQNQGLSTTTIITETLGFSGRNYQLGKKLFDVLTQQ
ncbi:hypothetical protein [Nostoc sp.]|uniref:hypothetical protein n=1 Tax=Nostoc sp. TaxID=1180 RepID=UPI002FFB97AA